MSKRFILYFSFLSLAASTLSGATVIATGVQFSAVFSLQEYNIVCVGQGPCEPFPTSIMPFVETAGGQNPLSQYGLVETLVSMNNGNSYAVGTIPMQVNGQFIYNGGGSGFPIPNDPTFWGANPATATLRMVFLNVGAPFTLMGDPYQAINLNLDSAMANFRVAAAPVAGSIQIGAVPEPSTLWLSLAGLAWGWKRARRVR